ncbi:LOW QUALITY PROTEIN: hypothetical protein Cgig2_003876 [Carnegiea gigantea]|uniref:Uncharacterized protein n=1 Tax=Carnegiea gigantea TaxID=171969 RepID=A0A9Q1GLS3_9CARY|nr:LOW QUALITY PROTEIN: hypothetical protein Cgig2_003876 [Carnegiea gigantea]
MLFDGREGLYFTSPHNDQLVVEMKVASNTNRHGKLSGHHNVGLFEETQCWQAARRPATGPRVLPCQHPATSGAVSRVWATRTSTFRQKAQTAPPPPTEALVIHTLASVEPKRSCAKAVDGIEEIHLDEEHPDRWGPHHHYPGALRPHHLHHQESRPHYTRSPHHPGHLYQEIHQLRVMTLVPILTVVLDVLNVRLKAAFLLKRVRGEDYQEFLKELCAILMPMPVALILSPSRLLSPRGPPSLPPRPPSPSSASPSGAYTRLPTLSTFGTPAGGRQFAPVEASPGMRQTQSTSWPLTLGQRPHLNNRHLLLGDLGWLGRARGGTRSTLRIIPKNEKPDGSKKEVIFKVRQLGKPIQRLPVTRLAPLTLQLFPHIHYPGHDRGHQLWTVVFPHVIMEVMGRPYFLHDQLPKRTMDRLPVVPIGKISPTRLTANEKELPPPRQARKCVPAKSEEVEGEVEGEVEDIHNPFEDSKERFEDDTVNWRRDEEGSRLPLSRKLVSLSKRDLRA